MLVSFFLLNLCHFYTRHWFTRILTTVTLHGAQRIHPIWIAFSTYRNASSESFVKLNILPILHPFFGLLITLTFLTLMRSLLRVLCTHIIITSFLIRLTPPLLLIAKYTHIILKTLTTTDHISVEQTLNSSQSSV